MLPPDLSGFAFHPAEGAGNALAARAEALRDGGRVLVLGASHPTLLGRLAALGVPLVVVDSSRSALRRARDTLPVDAELLAEDPRELDPPGGVSVALVTATAWRAVTHDADRQRVLRSLDACVGPAGTVVLELEQVPLTPAGTCGTLRWRRDDDYVVVSRHEGPADMLLTAAPVEALAAEAAAARGGGAACLFSFDDAGSRPSTPAASRVHVVATRAR